MFIQKKLVDLRPSESLPLSVSFLKDGLRLRSNQHLSTVVICLRTIHVNYPGLHFVSGIQLNVEFTGPCDDKY